MVTEQDMNLLNFENHQDYITSYVTKDDYCYLRNIRHCRYLTELGYRSATRILSANEFTERKNAVLAYMFPSKGEAALFSRGKNFDDPVLRALALRERANNQKILSTILYVRFKRNNGFEISSYIDYDHSLRRAYVGRSDTTDWYGVFHGNKKIIPRRSDMSFFDWHHNETSNNNSLNYFVIPDHDNGLTFMHKGDHKMIYAFKNNPCCDRNFYKTTKFSPRFGVVCFLDHIIRRKM